MCDNKFAQNSLHTKFSFLTLEHEQTSEDLMARGGVVHKLLFNFCGSARRLRRMSCALVKSPEQAAPANEISPAKQVAAMTHASSSVGLSADKRSKFRAER